MTELVEEILLRGKNVVAKTVYQRDAGAGPDAVKGLFELFAVIPVQTHSLNVKVIDGRYRELEDTDALVTFKPDIPIGVRTADCVPVMFWAPDVPGVGVAHAGWRGTLGGIVEKVADILIERGADPARIEVVLGASISAPDYEVGEDLALQFEEAGFADFISRPDSGKPHIDLAGINIERLRRKGIVNILVHPGSTFSSRNADGTFKYQSYRRDRDRGARILSTIVFSDRR